MQLRIRHLTRYRYDRFIAYTAQVIRLTPHSHDGQRVLRWRVATASGGALPRIDDGYGNVVHMLSLDRDHHEAAVIAEGEVETQDTAGVVRGAIERLPPAYFLRRTEATAPDRAILDLAQEAGTEAEAVERLHRLMLAVRNRVDYEIGATHAATTAAQALAQGRGVCQDHAHVFIAAARALGFPARYVSGYLRQDQAAESAEAGHAWAEAYVSDLGWVGFDAANAVSPTAAYVRVAIGLDAGEAAPVRGVRRGEGEESLSVSVDVLHGAAQQ